MGNNLEVLEGTIRAETEKAVLFFDGEQEVWLPKSQIHVRRVNSEGRPESSVYPCEIEIPEWLAYDKGLI